MKKTIEKIAESTRSAAVAAGAGFGAAKLVYSLLHVSEKDPKTIKKFGFVVGGVIGLVVAGISVIIGVKKNWDTKQHVKESDADASRYERERRADAERYTVERMAEENLVRTKAESGVYMSKRVNNGLKLDDDPDYPEEDADAPEQNKLTWIEKFKAKFTMPTLPPFLENIMSGVPIGYEEGMLLHLCSMLGAMCFSKVRAKYLDNIIHAPNLQVIVEGNWGTGKGKFEQIFKTLFHRIIRRSLNKIEFFGQSKAVSVIQTTGIGTSMTRFVDILAANYGCHMYLFNSEIRALYNDLRKGNGINFDFLRKAFENGDVCRNTKAKDTQNGVFPIFLNYTITGTPVEIMTSFKKELEGGTLSRIAWTCIPEAGRYPGVLRLPEGAELEALRDQIDDWTDKYCCHFAPGGSDEPAQELLINLDYVCKALNDWNNRQYEQSIEENNPARKDIRVRTATIAFHCAIVLHMLFDAPDASDWGKRKQVVDLTLFIANYCTERFLHKFGEEQNKQRKINEDAELVSGETPQTAQTKESTASNLITDIATLKALHDIKDKHGKNEFGWDTLAAKSGMSSATVRRKILDYEAKMGQ